MINSTADISIDFQKELKTVAGGSEFVIREGMKRAFHCFSCGLTKSDILLAVKLVRKERFEGMRLG